MENVVGTPPLDERYGLFAGRRVLVTGHSGFKGSWLAEWLLLLGAEVHGIALPPEGEPPLFDSLRLAGRMHHAVCDIRDAAALQQAVPEADPELVFHLAAQALVRRSYRSPLDTWATNVMGTLNLLESLRRLNHPVWVVVVTSDKVYRNTERDVAYREDDELGGHDPYSASKAACEMAVASWRSAFAAATRIAVATARAGNVIGGGDDSEDRIVPDCFRAWRRGAAVRIRNPEATRPWQHVLDPLSGYLELMWHLRSARQPPILACNFGPEPSAVDSVLSLVRRLAERDGSRHYLVERQGGAPHEARSLALNIDRARECLQWTPTLDFEEAVAWTDAGYSAPPGELPAVVRAQVEEFQRRRCSRRAP